MPVRRGDVADLTCDECGAVVGTVDAGQAEGILLRMTFSGGVCSETCPQFAGVNTFPGFALMEAYTCRHLRPRYRDSEAGAMKCVKR